MIQRPKCALNSIVATTNFQPYVNGTKPKSTINIFRLFRRAIALASSSRKVGPEKEVQRVADCNHSAPARELIRRHSSSTSIQGTNYFNYSTYNHFQVLHCRFRNFSSKTKEGILVLRPRPYHVIFIESGTLQRKFQKGKRIFSGNYFNILFARNKSLFL